jgi:hypothetical protein
MPSNYIARASIPDPEKFKAHLGAVFARAVREGIHISAGKGSGSALLRLAVEWGAKYAESSPVKAIVALPERTGSVDADRLRAAMGTMTPIEVCRAAGLKDSASIRNVTNKGAALAGKLRAWVENQEAGK